MDVEQIVREHIDKTVHLSLGTSKDNRPWVCEVHFVYDDQLNLYFRSLKTRRHSQEIAANSRVAGNIVRQHQPGESPHAIYFEGTAECITDVADREAVFPHFERAGLGRDILEDAAREDGHQFYKISIETWYAFGKFDGDSAEKFELPWS